MLENVQFVIFNSVNQIVFSSDIQFHGFLLYIKDQAIELNLNASNDWLFQNIENKENIQNK